MSPILFRRCCTWCYSSTDLDGPCRNCGLTAEEARFEEALFEAAEAEMDKS